MKRRQRLIIATVAATVGIGASGCGWESLNSLPLPGAEGTGEGSYQVRIQMPNVTTLSPNSPVRVDDVTVGSVQDITVEGWHALVTVSINPGVELPANAVAKIGQTSLLGSNHLELAPPTDVRPEGVLKGGDVIPLDRAGAYPTTEQTLSSLSVVLNGGGLAQLQDITRELNIALDGREGAVHDLLPQITELVTKLDAQKGEIVAALSGLDRVAVTFAQEKDTLAAALEQIHPALQVLVEQRPNLTNALVALGVLSDTATRLIDSSGEDLRANLKSLAPVLKSLADTGDDLTNVLSLLITFPFPMKTMDHAIKGDYANLMMMLDLTGPRLDANFLTGTPLGGSLGGPEGVLGTSAGTAAQQGDPYADPLRPMPPAGPAAAPTIPGLPPIPGLPAIPGITVPLPGVPTP